MNVQKKLSKQQHHDTEYNEIQQNDTRHMTLRIIGITTQSC